MPKRKPAPRSTGGARTKKKTTPKLPAVPAFTETEQERTRRVRNILRILKKKYPVVECALQHKNAYELLVATILSAQCTDERVNRVTPVLFEKYPGPAELATAKQASVEKIIHSLGFFRAKATSLIGMAKALVELHHGEVPDSLDELVKLPGVGRKTANVVLGTWFGIPTGIVVDTHVRRISRLLGLTESKQPEKIEQDLMAIIPKKQWIDFSHRLIFLGREICIARKPRCPDCPLLKYCPRVGLPAE